MLVKRPVLRLALPVSDLYPSKGVNKLGARAYAFVQEHYHWGRKHYIHQTNWWEFI